MHHSPSRGSAVGKERMGLWAPGAQSTPAELWEMMFEGRGTQHGEVVKHNLEQAVQPGSEPALARPGREGAASPGDPRLPQTPAHAAAPALESRSWARHLQRKPAVPSRGSRAHCSRAAERTRHGGSILLGEWGKGVWGNRCPKSTHSCGGECPLLSHVQRWGTA